MNSIRFDFEGLPTSVNKLYTVLHGRKVLSGKGKKFKNDFLTWLKTKAPADVKKEGRVTCSPMNLSRIGVYIWKQAVEKAGSFDVDKVRVAAIGQKFKGPAGEATMQANHHLNNPVFIGETLPNGQLKIVKSLGAIAGEPFSEKFLPAKK